MGNRNPILRILTFAPLSLVAIGSSAVETATAQSAHVSAGAGVRTAAYAGSAAVSVAWTLQDEDIYSCESAAYDLRALIRSYGSQVAIQAIAVDADPTLVASFLRAERLNIPVTYLSARQYQVAYGSRPLPGVAVKQSGRLVEVVNSGQMHVRGRRDTSSLNEIVANLVGGVRYSLAQH
jgi:hypothetical protein